MGSVFGSGISMFKSVFGTANDRLLKKMGPMIKEINSHEPPRSGNDQRADATGNTTF